MAIPTTVGALRGLCVEIPTAIGALRGQCVEIPTTVRALRGPGVDTPTADRAWLGRCLRTPSFLYRRSCLVRAQSPLEVPRQRGRFLRLARRPFPLTLEQSRARTGGADLRPHRGPDLKTLLEPLPVLFLCAGRLACLQPGCEKPDGAPAPREALRCEAPARGHASGHTSAMFSLLAHCLKRVLAEIKREAAAWNMANGHSGASWALSPWLRCLVVGMRWWRRGRSWHKGLDGRRRWAAAEPRIAEVSKQIFLRGAFARLVVHLGFIEEIFEVLLEIGVLLLALALRLVRADILQRLCDAPRTLAPVAALAPAWPRRVPRRLALPAWPDLRDLPLFEHGFDGNGGWSQVCDG